MIGQRKLTGKMSDRDKGRRGSRRNVRQKIYYVGEDLSSHCLGLVCLRPSVQTVLSVEAEWLSGPDCPGGQADREGPLQEQRTEIPLIGSRQRKLLLDPSKAIQQYSICSLLYCHSSQSLPAVTSQPSYLFIRVYCQPHPK